MSANGTTVADRLNPVSALPYLLNAIGNCRAIDLAQPLFIGAPHHPAHPAYLYSLNKKHGDYVNPGGASSASEAIALGTHVGTHIDAFCHFSAHGALHGGEQAAGVQSYAGGLERHSIDHVGPIFRRGVLLDVAKQQGLDVLPQDFEIRPEHLQSFPVEIRDGDVVLIRTGWARYWEDAAKFISQVQSPGPNVAAARWLSATKIFAAGSDTAPFEFQPNPAMSVHVHLLVESGIHIIECLDLEELSASDAQEFLFLAAPLKIRGGTGSPIRPFALIDNAQPTTL